jgi:hypothetical protein
MAVGPDPAPGISWPFPINPSRHGQGDKRWKCSNGPLYLPGLPHGSGLPLKVQ